MKHGIHHNHSVREYGIIVLAIICLACPVLLTGCPEDDTTRVAQVISGGDDSSTSSNSKPTPPDSPGEGDGQPAGLKPAGSDGAPVAQPAGGEGETGDATPPEEEGSKIQVEIVEIKAPYPEYEDKGRYDIRVEVLASEPVDAGTVWAIIAYDAEEGGEEVGKQEQQIAMPHTKPKLLIFNDFYCMKMPKRIEFVSTDKEAQAAGEGSEMGSGRGADGSGGSGSGDGGTVAGSGLQGS